MTTPEESIAAAAPAPKYRYFTAPPEVLHLKVEDLTTFLPEGAWIGRPSDKQREIAVPAAKILGTNYPRIEFSQLCDLLPGCMDRIADAPEWIALPTDRVALAYKLEFRRELIPESPAENPPAQAEPSPAEPKLELPIEPPAEAPVPAWKRLPKPMLAPAPESAPIAETKIEEPKKPTPFAELRIPSAAEPRLQDVFGMESALSVQRLIELCSGLPGVKACMLKRGADHVKAGDILAGLENASLSSEAFAAVRKLGATSGLKLKKALTFYDDSGPVSFLRHRDSILTVLHTADAPVPETLAKLKTVLQAIERAAAPQD